MFSPDDPIIQFVPPPQLHIQLGVVNWLYEILESVFERADKWYKHYHITQSPYHGNKFEGNACHRLLQEDSLQFLRNMLAHEKFESDSLAFRVVASMDAFRKLRHLCFTTVLRDGYLDAITVFQDSIEKLGRERIPTKV